MTTDEGGDEMNESWIVEGTTPHPGAVCFDLDAHERRVFPESTFDHHVWLDACSSTEDAAALWHAFGHKATPERVDSLLRLRPPKYLHHDNATHQVRVVNVDEQPVERLPSGHLVTGLGGPQPKVSQ